MPGIDGLRALAVAAVFLYHANPAWVPGGFLGVDVFFVISGYLITSLLLAEHAETGGISLLRFWARRARRLLPALFVLIGACLLIGATLERGKLVSLHGDALASIFYVANWRFVFEHESYFAAFGRPPLLRHLWSLAVEEQFYLLWPPLFVLGMRLRRRLALPLLVAAAVAASTALMWALYTPGTDTSRVFYGTDTRAAPLLVGVLLAFAWKPSALPRLRGRRPLMSLQLAGALSLGGVLYAFFAVHDFDPGIYRGGFLLLSLCTAVLLATIAHPMGLFGHLLARPIPRWLGERSYAIYLWHWPVIAFSRPGVDVHMATVPLVALQAALTLLLSDLSFRYVERPIREGALRRLRLSLPSFAAQPRTPLAATGIAIAALLALVAATPNGATALPPGFTQTAIAQSNRAAHGLVLPPVRTTTHSSSSQTRSSGTHTTTSTSSTHSTTTHHTHHHTVSLTRAGIPHSGPILAVGDSVMLGASSAMESLLGPELHVDAVVSRQPEATIARLLAYRAEGSLPQRVIVHIGDNGPVYYADAQRLKAALAGVPLVILLNVRVDTSWQGEVNSELRQTVQGWHQATIADWYDASSGAGMVVDGTHTSPQGAHAMASLLSRALHHPHLGGITR